MADLYERVVAEIDRTEPGIGLIGPRGVRRLAALRVAVVWHRPARVTLDGRVVCATCVEGGDISDSAPFPCAELRAIADALGVAEAVLGEAT